MARQAFDARIGKIGINPCVAVPLRISRALAVRGYLNWLKTPEALERNVRKVIAELLRPAQRRRRGTPLSRPGGSYARVGETRVQSS